VTSPLKKEPLRVKNTFSVVPTVQKKWKKNRVGKVVDPEFDVVIIGGGPGGLSASIIASLRGMRVLVLESGSFGGPLASLYPEKLVLNYPGFPEGILAKDIASRLVSQAEKLSVEMRYERVLKITREKEVQTDEETYRGKAIIIASGSRPREVGILGEMEFNQQDKGVYYFVTDLESFRGRKVVIAGGGDTAVDSTLALVDVADKVMLIHRKDVLRARGVNAEKVLKSNKVELIFQAEIQEIKGGEKVESVVLKDKSGGVQEVRADAVILALGLVPNNEIFADLGLDLDYEGKINTDPNQKTNIDGIYAVGDIVAGTGGLELIVVAVAQGAVAAHHAYIETATPYWGT
jgi:thioredoxin reductase (NADPH)